MKRISSQRNTGLDVIRSFAFFSVIAVHFLMNNGFYYKIIVGPRMLIMTFMRSCFMVCVPLFLMLTGYLVTNKTPNRKYYRKLLPILAIYLMSSICCAVYRLFSTAGQEPLLLTLKDCVTGLFSFRTAPYSWYVEMYIGLFLLAPFLNILYDNIPTRREKQYLLATFLFLTAVPGMTNSFRFAGLDWWLLPSSSGEYVQLLPQWWKNMYPITYFYLGRCLRDYPVKGKLSRIAAVTLIAFCLSGLFNCYRSYNSTFVYGGWEDYESLLNVFPCVMIFVLFTNLNYDRLPLSVKRIFANISEWSFGAYLVSWIFDKIFYARLNEAVPVMAMRLEWFPMVVSAVFACSLALSALLNAFYGFLVKRLSSPKAAASM